MATVEGPSHVVRYVNPAFCRLVDKPAEELVGKSFGELLVDGAECVTLLDRVFRTGKPESHTEEQHSKPNPVFWSYTMWPVIADQRTVGVMVQVTETAQSYEKTLAMNEALILGSVRQHELTEAADASNAQLQAAEAILLDAEEHKNEFLALLAHELRNPLAPLRFAMEIVRRADGNRDVMRPALGTMERQLGQMTRLVDDLLDVARISQGKLDLRPGKIELASVIHPLVEAARPACESARQDLTVTLPPQPVYLHADPVRLTQVFGNLLNNASKFTPRGGHVSLTAERSGSDVVVTVRDTGIGIPSKMLPKIFDVFTQGDQTLERPHGGLGIGLTLVRRLVEMHGGSVEAFSDGPDRGSEFVVRLPALTERPEPLPPGPMVRETGAIAPRRILVVDDNHDTAEALTVLLKMSGHETHTSFDGQEAVEAAATFKPDVILLDIGLPKLNGYDAARRIRELPGGKEMMLVAMTGWGQDEDRQKTADAGFDSHLVKPVEYAVLTKLLASAPGVGRSH